MALPDKLFSIRNLFYVGQYQVCIEEAEDLEDLQGIQEQEKLSFVYRSQIALGKQKEVISQITDDAPIAHQAIKLLAEYQLGTKQGEQVLQILSKWMADPACQSNTQLLVLAGIMFTAEGEHTEALKACHGGYSLEALAMCVQVYIKMSRIDKAEETVKKMSQQDDDAVMSQLALAWLDCAKGGSNVKEAINIYQEMGDRYGWTPRLHNNVAVCKMRQLDWDGALTELQSSHALSDTDADTLANMAVTALHLNKPAGSYLQKLGAVDPNHALIKKIGTGKDMFQRAAAAVG